MNKYNRLPLEFNGISSSYEEHISRGSRGQDFGWNNNYGGQYNTPVYAINDGVVQYIDSNDSCGNYIWIKHEFDDCDMWSRYLHLKDNSIVVKEGQKVTRGQKIATMGGTYGYAVHLHYELWKVPKGWKFNWNDRLKYVVRGTDYTFAFYDQVLGTDTGDNVFTRVLGTNHQTERDTTKNQIEVVGTLLRIRKGAGTNQTVLGYVDLGLYDFTETKESNNYTWYHIEDGWIAGTKEDTKVYLKEEPKPTPTPTDDKDKKIKELQDEIEKLNKSINEQKQTIEEQNIKIDQLVEELNKKPNLKEYEAQGDIYIKLKSKDKIYY